ncbi:MAG TPA: HlyD family efflux transporter periplasmic adaptor subunit [Gammaproteobacteria bacterium]|nr:HlyD family efflux transporter periplasmic adaptor subunit [Gammaproteobacteria bacterium]
MLNPKHWILLVVILLLLTAGCSRQERLQGYIEGEYINLSSNYSGILKQLLVSRGDLVKENQLIYVLDSEPEASELSRAEQQLTQAKNTLADLENPQRATILQSIIAQREQAQANLKFSLATLQRYQNLFAQGAISRQQLDQAQSDYQRDLNQVNQYAANLAEAEQGARQNQIKAQTAAVFAAEAAVDQASWELAQKTMYAPAAGRIYDTYYRVGEFVTAQQPVASLLTPDNIYLIFYIPEPDRSKLAVDQTVEFSCDSCEGRFTAKINYISPEAEYTPPVIFSRESRIKLVYRVQARLPLEEAKRFYPGQPVDVYIKP